MEHLRYLIGEVEHNTRYQLWCGHRDVAIAVFRILRPIRGSRHQALKATGYYIDPEFLGRRGGVLLPAEPGNLKG